MTEKQPNNKYQRHESAKAKYQHYQRVLSSKNLLKNTRPITPYPGQFLVEENKQFPLPALAQSKSSILLTKNIRSIVQKTNPVSFNQLLSQVVSKKTMKCLPSTTKSRVKRQTEGIPYNNQQQPYFKRPISAKIYHQTEGRQVEESQILRKAYEEDMKNRKQQQIVRKNYFQVKPKLKIPKHIHGYNTVVLQQQRPNIGQIEQQIENEQFEKHLNSKIDRNTERNFLPTEYYFSQSISPEQLMEKYKDQNDIVVGFSRWFHVDGTSSWKRCRVLKYDHQEQRWQIQWLGTEIVKKVSRNNLYFEKQNFEQFTKVVEAAEELRKRSQIFTKYNILINLMNSPTSQISSTSLEKIKLLGSVKICNEDKMVYSNSKQIILEQIKRLYARSCHQFEFNMTMPYNGTYKRIFEGVLPNSMFDPNPRKMIMNDQKGTVVAASAKQCSQIFSNGLKKMKQRCFLNSEKKIKILELINIMSEELSMIDLLKDYKRFEVKCYEIEDLQTIINRNISQYFYKINCRICDIEYHVSKQLDPLYANKKLISEQSYNFSMNRYHKFLLLCNMRIQAILRQSAASLIKTLLSTLPSFKHCHNNKENDFLEMVFLKQNTQLKIIGNVCIRDQKLQVIPSPDHLTQTIKKSITRITHQLKYIKCISKSYLPQIRPNNMLQVTNENYKTQQLIQLEQIIEEVENKIKTIEITYNQYIQQLSCHIENVYQLGIELSKKSQKKISYGEIQELIEKINIAKVAVSSRIKIQEFYLCGIFSFNFQDVKSKVNSKVSEVMKETVSLLMDKINKDNQKMQKNVNSLLETMEKIPTTISEFVELETFVTETVKQEIEKAHSRAKNLTQKMNILEKTSHTIDYKQFQSCCQIYLKPLRLIHVRNETLHKLENIYKKNFAQDLMKESYVISDNIKSCEKLFAQTLANKTLQEMDLNFNLFSQLNSQIENSCQKMSAINDKEDLLKWNKTNFDRLLQLKQQFQPYYKLITLHKNFRLNLVPLLEEAFSQINYQLIYNNVTSSLQTLNYLHGQKFQGDLTYEPIAESILNEYQQFNKSLPLIKALRNPDLRDRHWVIIESITGIENIRGEEVILKQILCESVKEQSEELYKISQIATKELIYEKSLNQLKREWKDVKITIKEMKIENQNYKFIKNIPEIEKKLQNDLLEVNNILSSSFIKFLQADISHWKSSVLEKVYQFINYWPNFESKIIFYIRLLNSPKLFENLQSSGATLKNLQKFWKQFINFIEYQASVVQIANTRTWQSITSLEALMQEVQKMIYGFLEQKKKLNSKLRLFSDDALISMMIQCNNQIALQSMRKCFTGARSLKLIQQNGQQNVQIMNNLDEKILVQIQESGLLKTQQLKTQKNLLVSAKQISLKNIYQFDQLLFSIDRQLRKQIKSTFLSSLQHHENENHLICQVELLRNRVIFSNKVQTASQQNRSLQKLELENQNQQKKYIQKLRNKNYSKRLWKAWSIFIVDLMNQTEVIRKLSCLSEPITECFQWFKQPRYELIEGSTSKLKLVIGNYSRQYMFELVECKKYIVNPMNDSIFLNICTALNDRMLVMLDGKAGCGKVICLEYLAQLMGRTITQVCCNELTSAANMIEYLKIGASGIFLTISRLQVLERQCLSAFSSQLSQFWTHYQLARNQITNFKLSSKDLLLDIQNFAFVGICQSMSHFENINMPVIRQCFRSYSIPQINFFYYLKCVLQSVGISDVKQEMSRIIEDILAEINYQNKQGNLIGVNRNKFIWQVAQQIQDVSEVEQEKSQQQNDGFSQDFLQNSILKVLENYIPLSSNKSNKIWKGLQQLKLLARPYALPFKKIEVHKRISNQQNDPLIKEQKYYKSALKNTKNLKKILKFHNGAIVIGSIMSGKSTIINSLFQEESITKYNFSSLNALAYTFQELYEGINCSKGIIRQMVQEVKMKASGLQLNHEVINGLYFDCSIGYWAEPLLSIINKPDSPQISCPDGSLFSLPSEIKLLFEAQSLSTMTPHSFHSIGILNMSQQLGWKTIVNPILDREFSNNFSKSPNAIFIKLLLQQTFDSIIEFYQSVCKEHVGRYEPVILSSCAILQSCIKFLSQIYHKEDIQIIENIAQTLPKGQKEVEEKIKSQIFNVYTYSIVATLGLLIPHQARKTFSRHLKYVLQQSHLGRYGWKKSNILNKDDENIYEFFYEHGDWCKWKSQKNCFLNQRVLRDQDRILQKVLQHHIQNGNPCFLVGQDCSSKNYFLKNYLAELEMERYSRNYFVCSSLTKKIGISNKIMEMIQTEKYSRKVNGFSNCKKNIIFIQDLNMTMFSQSHMKNGSVVQFLREFYRKKSWFIDGNLYGFCNLQFYGTLNKQWKMPRSLIRYLNLIMMGNSETRVKSILEHTINQPSISNFEKQLIIRCTMNLQEAILRDLPESPEDKLWLNSFNLRDMIRVIKGVCKITETIPNLSSLSMHGLLKLWIYVVDKVYSQKISHHKKGFLFYQINNVLMEEQRVRYKTICPNSNFYILPVKQVNKESKKGKTYYNLYTIQQLTEKMKVLMENASDKYKNLSMLSSQQCYDLLKLMVRLSNSFQFQSKMIIFMNEQRRRLTPTLKLLALSGHYMLYQTRNRPLNNNICAQNQQQIQKSISCSFTKTYYQNFDSTSIGNSKFVTPFQSQFQTKAKIEGEVKQKLVDEISNKHRIIFHIQDAEDSSNQSQNIFKDSGYNFLLEDLLAYRKLNKHPKWMIPRQDTYQSYAQFSQTSITNKKSAMFLKYLSNRDSMELTKQIFEREQLCKKLDINVILQYNKYPDYLLKFYLSLVGESSLIFLKNPVPQASSIDKTSKIIMTDVKYDQDLEDEFVDNFQLKSRSCKQLGKLVQKHGNKVYIDLIYEIFQQILADKWYYKTKKRSYGFKASFRSIFNKFENSKKMKQSKKTEISDKIQRIQKSIQDLKQKLEQKKKEEEFSLSQIRIRQTQINSRIEKEGEKYGAQKKKIFELIDKIKKKQQEYQQNINGYRQSMDKFAFEFNKCRQKITKVIVQFQTGKLNIANAMSIQNKLLIQGFVGVLSIIQLKKNQQASMVSLKQFNKLLKQKKLSKIVGKINIQGLSSKGIERVEKIMHQYQILTSKMPVKKIPDNAQINESSLLKNSLHEYLQICLTCDKQFSSPKIKQFYENSQSLGKTLEKSKLELGKKEKNKANKELFEVYDNLIQQKKKLEKRIEEGQIRMKQITQILIMLSQSLSLYLPRFIEISKREFEDGSENDSNPLIMAITLRYFNQLHNLTAAEVTNVLALLNQKLQIYQLPPEIGFSLPIKLHSDITLSSLFNYKGVVLLQARSQVHQTNQQFQNIAQIIKQKEKIMYQIFSEQLSFWAPTPSDYRSYGGIIIKIKDNEIQHITEQTEKVLNDRNQEDWNKLILIQANQFSEQLKQNFPWICVNHDLKYQQIEQIGRDLLYGCSQKQKKSKIGEDKDRRRSYRMDTKTNEMMSEMLKFQFSNSQILDDLTTDCLELKNIFNSLNQESSLKQSETPLDMEPSYEPTLTEKQKQKLHLEQKTLQFFCHLYLILQPQHLSIYRFFQCAQSIIKSHPNCHIVNSFDSTSFKYIHKLKKQLHEYLKPFGFYLLHILINAANKGCPKLFGTWQCFQRYIQIYLQQVMRTGQHIEDEERKEKCVQMAKKLVLFIPSLSIITDEVLFDYDLWVEDIKNIYKEQREPPVEQLVLMLKFDRQRLTTYMRKLERKMFDKYSLDTQFFEYGTVLQQLQSVVCSPAKILQVSITPIFIDTPYSLHEITSLLKDKKLDYQFIDISSFLQCQNELTNLSSIQSKRTQKKVAAVEENVFDGSKILLAPYSNYSHRDISMFLQIALSRIQSKRVKFGQQDEFFQVKIILFNIKEECSQGDQFFIKNSQIFKRQKNDIEPFVIQCYNMLTDFYSALSRDKMKLKQYEQLPLKMKRLIYEILMGLVVVLINLPIRNWTQMLQAIRRCKAIMDRIIKISKTGKGYDNYDQLRMSFKQNMYELGKDQIENINEILSKVENQSVRMVDEQANNSVKFITCLKQSDFLQKLRKIIMKVKHGSQFNLKERERESANIDEIYDKNSTELMKKDRLPIKIGSSTTFEQLIYSQRRTKAIQTSSSIQEIECGIILVNEQNKDISIVGPVFFRLPLHLHVEIESEKQKQRQQKISVRLDPYKISPESRNLVKKCKLMVRSQNCIYPLQTNNSFMQFRHEILDIGEALIVDLF